VALLTDLANALPEGSGEDEATANAHVEGDDGETPEEESVEEQGDEPPEPESAESDAPEFWSAEDKAQWASVPAELRPLLKKYEDRRTAFVNEKSREAAAVREQARQEVGRLAEAVGQSAAWWQQAGPLLQRAFADKWSQVNWTELAEKSPGEWAKLNQQRMDEAALLAEARRRGDEQIRATEQRRLEAFQEARRAEHAKLAEKLPDWFGTPETARKTYGELGRWLLGKGIAAERVSAIHEAPIIELALDAMRFEQARRKAISVTHRGGAANGTARPTPTRVAPGPASRPGNRNADALRQVGERIRQSGGADVEDAAELIRLNGL
jgi:hypothetical protein